MIKLKIISGLDLETGAEITPLSEIEENVFYQFTYTPPVERCIFIDEEFITFDCICNFDIKGCELKLVSQISFNEELAWAYFSSCNVEVYKGEVFRRIVGNFHYVCQTLRVRLENDKDSGHFQLVCLAEEAEFQGGEHHRYEIITFHVYRDRMVRNVTPFPAIFSIKPDFPYNYIPVVVGQQLQVVAGSESIIKNSVEEIYVRNFTLGTERLQIGTFVYDGGELAITVTDNENRTVIGCPVEDELIRILKPVGDSIIYVKGLTAVEIISYEEDKWVWDEMAFDLFKIDNGIRIEFKKPVENITLQNDCGHWWVCECIGRVVNQL